jgi:hypothetical protein
MAAGGSTTSALAGASLAGTGNVEMAGGPLTGSALGDATAPVAAGAPEASVSTARRVSARRLKGTARLSGFCGTTSKTLSMRCSIAAAFS